MESVRADEGPVKAVDHRALAVSVIDISADIRRKSLNDTGVRPLSNGALEILRVIESRPGITVAEVAARLGRQFSNVSVQLRELVAGGLVTRVRDPPTSATSPSTRRRNPSGSRRSLRARGPSAGLGEFTAAA